MQQVPLFITYQQDLQLMALWLRKCFSYILFFFILIITLIQRKYLGGEVNYV